MNRIGSVVLGTALCTLLACGDDTSGNGTGGGSTSAGNGGATSASTTTATTAASTSGGGGEDGVGGDPTGNGGSGGAPGQGGSGGAGEGGGPSAAPCANECAGDPGCEESPAAPGEVCQGCIGEEIQAGFQSECAIEGATGDCCSSDEACGEYVDCLVAGGTPQSCAAENPAGGQKALACVVQACGDCGDGSIGDGGEGGGGAGAACADECAGDPGCDLMPADPGNTCRTCVQQEANQQSQCAVAGATSACCQDDAMCAAFVGCVLDGGGQGACAMQYPEGYARAEECLFDSCGECGMPM